MPKRHILVWPVPVPHTIVQLSWQWKLSALVSFMVFEEFFCWIQNIRFTTFVLFTLWIFYSFFSCLRFQATSATPVLLDEKHLFPLIAFKLCSLAWFSGVLFSGSWARPALNLTCLSFAEFLGSKNFHQIWDIFIHYFCKYCFGTFFLYVSILKFIDPLFYSLQSLLVLIINFSDMEFLVLEFSLSSLLSFSFICWAYLTVHALGLCF